MFRPNLKGQLARKTGRDVHGRATFSPLVDCPFGPINLDVTALKTSVRADTSASRGAAEEQTTPHARILVPKNVVVAIGDHFVYSGIVFEIITRHERYAVTGRFDHIELGMRVVPV